MFASRIEAGYLLAPKIFSEIKAGILLAILRGGVVVAKGVRKKLDWPLSLVFVKKLSAPQNEELAIGAVGEDSGSAFLNEELIYQLGINNDYLNQEIKFRIAQIRSQRKKFLTQSAPSFRGEKIVIIDDGAATGATIIAAARQVRKGSPDEVIVAVPVISPQALLEIKKEVDRVIYLESPKLFFSVGQFYQHFDQVSDEEVKRILKGQE
ncbi:MAG: phosphoribosyltransferase family protein [Candidatus Shapirobacteria bacterium]|nr:phosphoribosyltransferase family protein [Candidatus Shapirobacteria bacterium]MDD5073853.1 phosphoribosyltransferase family protein [Candidatus Shapirobacteria bacterium]